MYQMLGLQKCDNLLHVSAIISLETNVEYYLESGLNMLCTALDHFKF